MKSPGAPSHRREIQKLFWLEIAKGLTSEAAAVAVGAGPVLGSRWFRQSGGMPALDLTPISGRYLSFHEREEIALLRVQGKGGRGGFIGKFSGRDPATGAALALGLVFGAKQRHRGKLEHLASKDLGHFGVREFVSSSPQ